MRGTDGNSTSFGLHPAQPSTHGGSSPAPTFSPATHTILVADDDQAVRTSVTRALTSAGYQVVSATDGRGALEVFRREPVDLVLLDLSMPHQDGWTTFERMMACDPRVPVIIITGHDKQYARACSVGAGALLEKPIDIPALLDVIQLLLEESTRGRSRSGHGAPATCRYHEPDRDQFTAHQRFANRFFDAPLRGGINE